MTASPGNPLHHAGGDVVQLFPARTNVVNLAVRRFLKCGSATNQARALVNVIDLLSESAKVCRQAKNLRARAELLLARIG